MVQVTKQPTTKAKAKTKPKAKSLTTKMALEAAILEASAEKLALTVKVKAITAKADPYMSRLKELDEIIQTNADELLGAKEDKVVSNDKLDVTLGAKALKSTVTDPVKAMAMFEKIKKA